LGGDLERLRERDIEPVAIELTPDARPLARLERDGRVALVFGGETHGISEPILAACRERYAIPNAGPDEDGEERSLNVAVAAAIALHQRAVAS
jgi:tRNA G18 (ribose-2'-O)-methylase SpoU